MIEPIRNVVEAEYGNTLGIVVYKSNGVGGSLIAVVPQADTVISMTCSLVYNPKARMELINDYILPFVESI